MINEPKQQNMKARNIVLIALIILMGLTNIGNASTARIMSVGDSITAGNVGNYSYRVPLFQLLTDAGIDFDFVGSTSTAYDPTPDKNHNGYPGKRIDYISGNIEKWLNSTPADIILLHIGTNDIFQGYYVETAPDRLNALIDKIAAKSPNTLIYVATIVPQKDDPATSRNESLQTITYNNAIRSIVKDKKLQDKNVILVDIYSQMNVQTDFAPWERLHPNKIGSNKMAKTWFDSIKASGVISVAKLNAIKNAGFELEETFWTFHTDGSGVFNVAPPGYEGNNAAVLSLNSGGANIQLYQEETILEPNTRYRLSFAAYSTSGHDLAVNLIKHDTPYTNYGLNFTADLGTDWQTFATEF
ncbi:MAG: GDSL-type esterase/lipase family protein, partial [Candidatus Methanoperedens sp.]